MYQSTRCNNHKTSICSHKAARASNLAARSNLLSVTWNLNVYIARYSLVSWDLIVYDSIFTRELEPECLHDPIFTRELESECLHNSIFTQKVGRECLYSTIFTRELGPDTLCLHIQTGGGTWMLTWLSIHKDFKLCILWIKWEQKRLMNLSNFLFPGEHPEVGLIPGIPVTGHLDIHFLGFKK